MADSIVGKPTRLSARMRERAGRLHANGVSDAGYSAVEWVIIIAIIIAIAVAASIIISQAVSDKATSVGTCIKGASSTNNGGCS